MQVLPPWNAEDSVSWRTYLNGATGLKLIAEARSVMPQVQARTFEEVSLEAKLRTGWEQCIEFLLRKAMPTPSTEQIEAVDMTREGD